jgi:large subunit ribosomal protein L32e
MSDVSKTKKKKQAAKPEEGKQARPKKPASEKATKGRKTSATGTKAKPVKATAAPRKTTAAAEKPKTARKRQPSEIGAEAPKVSARKKGVAQAKKVKAAARIERVRGIPAGEGIVDQRLFRIAQLKKHRLPEFRRENAHRWIRLSDSWRNVRGNDSYTRQKRKGRIAMVNAGYRTPRAVRDIHPSLHIEVPIYNVSQLEGLDPKVHAVRIGGTVGMRKRQEILKRADTMHLRVLNPGAPESVREEELFSELDTEAEEK